ncbi:TRS130 [[Candida] subhashii]|uniref:TRS130 n=1 Tax=[Candida] subhashii TaxID=561895 RepID=A0A8J5UUI1_9ASCO|nr:TRS130 [[Candida] subhashii]KAG7661700.1 TRS130 [[Candida] subhashii]
MDTEELRSRNPVKIGYYDPFSIYPKIKDDFEKNFPLTNLHLKFELSQPLKSIPLLPVSLVEEVPKKQDIIESDDVYTRLMFIRIESIDKYRSQVRPLIREWLKQLVFKSRSSWMIILFVPHDTKDKHSSLIKTSRFDKLRNDFGDEGKELKTILPGKLPVYDGARCFKLSENEIKMNKTEAYNGLLSEIKVLLISSFVNRHSNFRQLIKENKQHSIGQFMSMLNLADLLNDMRLHQDSLDSYDKLFRELEPLVQQNPNYFNLSIDLPSSFDSYNFEESFDSVNLEVSFVQKKDINLFQLSCLVFINQSILLQSLANASSSISLASIYMSRIYQSLIEFLNDLSRTSPNHDLREFQYSVIEFYLNLPLAQRLTSSISDTEESKAQVRAILEFRAELKLQQRSILIKLAEDKNYCIRGIESVLEEISLDDNQSHDNTQQQKPHEFSNPSLLACLKEKSDFFDKFESLTMDIIHDFMLCSRSKSIDVLSIDLVILNYEKQNYTQCLEILKDSYDFFISNGWNFLGGILLEIYIGCLEKVKPQESDEVLATCLKLFSCLVKSKSGINSYGLIKTKEQIEKLYEKINGYSLKQNIKVECSLNELFKSEVLLYFNADESTSRDRYYVNMRLENRFGVPFMFDRIELITTDQEGHEILFRQENVEISSERNHTIKLFTNSFIMGSFVPKRLCVSVNKMLHFVLDYKLVPSIRFNDSTIDPNASTNHEIQEMRHCTQAQSMLVFPNLDKFRAQFYSSKAMNLGSSNTLLKITNGGNRITDLKAKLFSTTNGLKINDTELEIDSLEPNEVKDIIIPYTYNFDNKIINMRAQIEYFSDGEKYVFEASYDINITLPISVSVQDIFKEDFIYWKFQIGTSIPEVPIRILDTKLSIENDKYSIVEPGIKLPELIAFGEQSVSTFYRIIPNADCQVSDTDSLDLIIKYSSLQEECEVCMDEYVIQQLEKLKLSRYWYLLKDALISKMRFELNKYAMDNIIKFQNGTELSTLGEAIIHEFVESIADKKILVKLLHDVLFEQEVPVIKKEGNILSLHISVPVPVIKYLQIVEYDFERNDKYVVGEPINVSLRVKTVNRWSSDEDSEKSQADEFQLMLQNDDNWSISGFKRKIFRHEAENEYSLETQLTLIPLSIGKILLPRVSVKSSEKTESDEISMDVVFKNGLESLLIVPDVKSITFAF